MPLNLPDQQGHRIARVAVAVPLYGLFDYLIPRSIPLIGMDGATTGSLGSLTVGCRVRVPFGRKSLTGVVMELAEHSSFSASRLKAISACIDSTPILPGEVVSLLNWSAQYYFHPIGEVVFAALPKRLRQGDPAQYKAPLLWRLTRAGAEVDDKQLVRAPKQQAIVQFIRDCENSGVSAEQFNAQWQNWRAPLQALSEKGLVESFQAELAPPGSAQDSSKLASTQIQLNAQQSQAAQAVINALGSYQAFLLQGITGSGKTEVYLKIIEQALAAQQQVLVLVPEISLTPQLIQRFSARLDIPITGLHSAMNDSQRHQAWLMASQGQARVIIGTRSALFTPMPELGLIILDEEHDASFKQQEGFRYHARDLALVRGRNLGIPVLMGSATPSFESLENVKRGQFQLLSLTARGAASSRPPQIHLLDVCRRPLQDGLSQPLMQRIAEHIGAQGQVLLFLNRRGFAPLLMCHECGWTTACKRCDANMTLHQHQQRLRCHHCGYETAAPKVCPQCQHESLHIPGAGTERIESALTEAFPDVQISRIDRDTTRRKGELHKKLEQARQGEVQILIGTQMLAKGHDFPNLTLVGILDVDQGLFSADFRGTEHMAQLIIQVAGRAGRGHRAGEVLIQTHHVEHPLLHSLLQSGYNGFAQAALEERRIAGFPPYRYMAILRSEATEKNAGQAFLQACRELFQYTDVHLFGPLPAPMERRAGRYRWQLIVMAEARSALHGALREWLPKVSELKQSKQVRWSIDIDPQDTY